MRRVLATLAVLGLMMSATAALGAVHAETAVSSYIDLFGSVSYSGSDGTISWDSPWKEIGESDGPSDGNVFVGIDPSCADTKCLHIFGQGETYSLIGVLRGADLSGFEQATLAYDVKRVFDESLKAIAIAELLVQVSSDGLTWKTIESFGLERSDATPIHSSKQIKDWISKTFEVRFVVTGTLGAEVFIDNVEITGPLPPNPTTTTSTTSTTTTTTKTTTATEPTTTTKPRPITTTTEPTTTTTSRPAVATPNAPTTTAPTTTSTTVVAAGVAPPTPPPAAGGIRETAMGVQANYSPGLFGSMQMGQSEVLGLELNADYKMAVEVIESSWVWIVGLLIVIAAAIVSGLDRRRTLRPPPDV